MKLLTYILIFFMASCTPKETIEEKAVFNFPYIKQQQSDGYPIEDLIAELENMKRPLSVYRECGMPPLELTLKKGLNQNGHTLELTNTHITVYGSKNKGSLKLECGSKIIIKNP